MSIKISSSLRKLSVASGSIVLVAGRRVVLRIAASVAAFAVLALFSLLVLGGCDRDPASSSAAGSGTGPDLTAIRACELLTAADIEAATGIAAAAGQDVSQVDGQLPICNWPRAGGAQFDTFVNLLVTRSSIDDYEEFLRNTRDTLFGEVFTEDSLQEIDVGDFGVWIDETNMLQVYEGGVMVQVTAEAAAGRDELEAARALAVAALDKLR
ncbi:MAG TPA: hypothetical protein VGC50_06310 [Gammaproteobacteria bacterium]|jgi:hypothetical protein